MPPKKIIPFFPHFPLLDVFNKAMDLKHELMDGIQAWNKGML